MPELVEQRGYREVDFSGHLAHAEFVIYIGTVTREREPEQQVKSSKYCGVFNNIVPMRVFLSILRDVTRQQTDVLRWV